MNKIVYINAEIGHSAGISGCQNAPKVISEKTLAVKNKAIATVSYNGGEGLSKIAKLEGIPYLNKFGNELAQKVRSEIDDGNFPIIIGGDHSAGFGTWSGACDSGEDYGLLWIDAHFDLHTCETSDTKNLHGMVVAGLMGYGDERLVNINYNGQKIKPENVSYIGIRSFETPEQQLAEELGIKVYYADDVNEIGFKKCFDNVVQSYKDKNIKWGISFDMDSLDTSEMSALGTPVDNGLILNDVIDTFNSSDMTGLNMIEVVEYNPELDPTGKDIIPVQKVLQCFDKDVEISNI